MRVIPTALIMYTDGAIDGVDIGKVVVCFASELADCYRGTEAGV